MGANNGKTAAKPPDRLTATLALDEPVSKVRLVNPKRAKALGKLGITTVRDLVTNYPRRYVDLSHVRTVLEAQIGEMCTVSGRVHEIKLKRPRPNFPLVEITLVDGTGTLMITCFRQPWLTERVSADDVIAVAGKIEFSYGFKCMTNPYLEVLEDGEASGMIIPVHPTTERVSVAWMRRFIGNALAATRGMYDPLPLDLRCRYRLMSRQSALSAIHFPQDMAEAHEARRRLAYEELLLLELFLMQEGAKRSAGLEPHAHVVDGEHERRFAAAVPFELTEEQVKARDELLALLAAPSVANHMILGDVGTGKTVVCAHALAAVADNGTQAALLAPTEVLARQHGESLGPLLEAAGVTYAVLTASTAPSERESILAELSSGEIDVLIGTHAMLEDDVEFADLTVAVIDEQQRFGVEQRARLLSKGEAPDAVFLTATPIPRTLALTLFGNLSRSFLTRRPHDDVNRTTYVLPKKARGHAYDAGLEALARGEQVYVVCPLIGISSEERDERADKSDAAASSADDAEDEPFHPAVVIEDDDDFGEGNIAAARQEAEFLQAKVFCDYRVELLHGGMPAAEKQEVMGRFKEGETQVLVATTVIEVGVDVPTATVMIVEDADRFGLSQLHQLRGRVGRGSLPAEVYLVSASQKEQALKRLRALEKTDDGYEVAKYDLSQRKEGDILGNRQSGASSLKLVNVIRDEKIVEAAHNDARVIMEADPDLSAPDHAALAHEVRMLSSKDQAALGG